MPLQETSGAASYDAFGGGVAVVPNYIESVFQTWLYTGNGSTQTITNGIDLAGNGGLVWIKCRGNGFNNALVDTARGANQTLFSNDTVANQNYSGSGTINTFSSTGFNVGTSALTNATIASGGTFVSWTFRKQPKFFDVVTYTGTGANRTIAHNLGSVPGCIIVKRTDAPANWQCYHRSLANTQYMVLNDITAVATGATRWNSTTPTSTVFSLGTDTTVNASGGTYVAYLFAHNAGGFGLTGTDNVISCGSCSTNGSGVATVDLGYEPQWLMVKRTDGANNWWMGDVMRGMTATGNYQLLTANTSDAEATSTNLRVSATGFSLNNAGIASQSFIYIAIRRGPMKVPTDATKVFAPVLNTGDGSKPLHKSNTVIAPDLFMNKTRDGVGGWQDASRLTGAGLLASDTTGAEVDGGATWTWDFMNGIRNVATTVGDQYWHLVYKRAPSFLDVVCYTGTGANTTQTHNLGVTPEWMIVKRRSNNDGAGFWASYSAATGNTQSTQFGSIAAALTNSTFWNNTSPTSTNFTVGTITRVNGSGETYVAYLFATCPGVSKCGSYTGNGSTQTINCGFTGGARFVLIKRTDSAGDWYTYDTARGMTTLTDPYLLMNSTAAETATLGSVTTVATGFALNSSILAAINASGGTYIFLAIS